jgi:hypothetical protein
VTATASVTRLEIARKVPRGSRRARGQPDFLRAALAAPELATLRADAAANMLEVARILARYMSWEDRLTMPVRARVCALAGISVSTWQRCRRRWEDWGYLGTVLEGTTHEFSSFLHRDDPNQAAVYVLAVPRRKRMTTRARDHDRISDLPPKLRRSDRSPARDRGAQPQDGPPSGRADTRTAGAPDGATAPCGAGIADALAGVLLRAGGETLSDGWAAWLARPFARSGRYTAQDLAWAVDHAPAGPQHRWTRDVRSPAGWLRKRLELWLDASGEPLPSRSQQQAAAHNRDTRERAARGWLTRRAAQILQTTRADVLALAREARFALEDDRARLRATPGSDLGRRGAQLARELMREAETRRRERMDFYDSTRPELIPDGAHACLYYDGDYAAAAAAADRFAAVRWITVTGDYEHCGIADFEKGNAVFSGTGLLREWVQGRLVAGHRARVYCDRANLGEVQDELEGLKWELWAATLDGDVLTRDWAPNLWGVQYGGGPTADYDTSILYGEW